MKPPFRGGTRSPPALVSQRLWALFPVKTIRRNNQVKPSRRVAACGRNETERKQQAQQHGSKDDGPKEPRRTKTNGEDKRRGEGLGLQSRGIVVKNWRWRAQLHDTDHGTPTPGPDLRSLPKAHGLRSNLAFAFVLVVFLLSHHHAARRPALPALPRRSRQIAPDCTTRRVTRPGGFGGGEHQADSEVENTLAMSADSPAIQRSAPMAMPGRPLPKNASAERACTLAGAGTAVPAVPCRVTPLARFLRLAFPVKQRWSCPICVCRLA